MHVLTTVLDLLWMALLLAGAVVIWWPIALLVLGACLLLLSWRLTS